ncbi:hypothetical protein BGZ83_010408 [Gryganskiella cystojenkinii]|nr:hypothetical protein BGZ83_010408 [Gryganskiella cystojenkinii]
MSTSSTSTKPEPPCVLIVGAGLGGLMLAALLEKAGIEYHVFERATKVKPLGSAMSIGPTILPALEQLGLLEEIEQISKRCLQLNILDVNMNPLASVKPKGQKDVAGYDSIVFARPDFYELMLRQVPPQKLYMGKRILQIKEKDDKVIIQCSDNTDYDGDILVGADGAYSAVRQNLYRDMDGQGLLPKSDRESLIAGFTCMVGVTGALDPERFPQLKEPNCQHRSIMCGNSRTYSVFTVPGNKICWAYTVRFEDPEEAKRQQFANSEWGPEANQPMIKEVYDLPCPFGGKMGDLIDATPQELISKVFLEHKMFQTWFHSRTVLLGDACHKMLPSAGQGAVNAMQDAVVLASCLYDLKDNSVPSLTKVFQSYYDQRYPQAKGQYENSQVTAKLMSGQRWHEKLVRQIVLNYLPDSFHAKRAAKSMSHRPQAQFLPMIPYKGTGPVLPQLPSTRYQKELAEKKKQAPVVV